MTLSKFLQKWRTQIVPESFDQIAQDLMEMMKPPANNIYTESTVGSRELLPLVSVKFGKYQFQVSPEVAREIGTHFIECAHAAELDAYCYQFFSGEMGVPYEQIGQMVAHFRHWREERAQLNVPAAEGKQ